VYSQIEIGKQRLVKCPAYPLKADIPRVCIQCPLSANSRHQKIWNNELKGWQSRVGPINRSDAARDVASLSNVHPPPIVG
jgi:hypothetical protein